MPTHESGARLTGHREMSPFWRELWRLMQVGSLLGVSAGVVTVFVTKGVVIFPDGPLFQKVQFAPWIGVWALGLVLGQISVRTVLAFKLASPIFDHALSLKKFYDFWAAPRSIFLIRSKAE